MWIMVHLKFYGFISSVIICVKIDITYMYNSEIRIFLFWLPRCKFTNSFIRPKQYKLIRLSEYNNKA